MLSVKSGKAWKKHFNLDLQKQFSTPELQDKNLYMLKNITGNKNGITIYNFEEVEINQ